MENVYAIAAFGILFSMVLALIRASRGPTVFDRILAVNMFGTMTVLFIGIMGYLSERPDFLDIAIVYALMNFISIIAVLRYRDFTVDPSEEANKHEHS
jgi:multicomponent Na+:H+ antiporter subunit F